MRRFVRSREPAVRRIGEQGRKADHAGHAQAVDAVDTTRVVLDVLERQPSAVAEVELVTRRDHSKEYGLFGLRAPGGSTEALRDVLVEDGDDLGLSRDDRVLDPAVGLNEVSYMADPHAASLHGFHALDVDGDA